LTAPKDIRIKNEALFIKYSGSCSSISHSCKTSEYCGAFYSILKNAEWQSSWHLLRKKREGVSREREEGKEKGKGREKLSLHVVWKGRMNFFFPFLQNIGALSTQYLNGN
jgi:hypothetical protein